MNTDLSQSIEALDFPMGPNVAAYLNVAFSKKPLPVVSPEQVASFKRLFATFIQDQKVDTRIELVELLEELVAMKFGDLALKLYFHNRELDADKEFRGLLALGNAAMLDQELEDAENWFCEAQKLAPEEPAPYVNLAQIYFHLQRDDEALEWSLAGIDHDKNNLRLWETVALVYQVRFKEGAGEQLKVLAIKKDSWAGLSLSAALIDPDDSLLKAQYLQDMYDQGERSSEFLVEYTAALGVAGSLEKVVLTIFQAEGLAKDPLSWQLYMHAAQASLGLDKPEEAMAFVEKSMKVAPEDPTLKSHIDGLIQEIDQTIQKNKIFNENTES